MSSPRTIPRTIQPVLEGRARTMPIVTLTGPRQSGKTTACRAAFDRLPYTSLETPETLRFATEDPRGFLAGFPDGAILDEAQRAPELFSYLQGIVDEDPRPGRWILTGSHQFLLMEKVSQSLAGRAAVLHLLPFSAAELAPQIPPSLDLSTVIFTGGYPRVHVSAARAAEWLPSYVAAYVERDVRTLLRVVDLAQFQSFLKASAARAGQLLNVAALGSDVGLNHVTARQWLSILEASFVAFRLPPFFRNVSKRLMKSPKLYFYDTGLLCCLLGIRRPEELDGHPLRGAVFENWVVTEALKWRLHRGLPADLCFFNLQGRSEVDLIVEGGRRLLSTEIKLGATYATDWAKSFDAFRTVVADSRSGHEVRARIVYGGADRQRRSEIDVVPWTDVADLEWEP